MASSDWMDDSSSQRSSLKSVFHEVLGDGLAKKVAELPFLVERTEREGMPLISRQRRETTRGDVKKFSVSRYRRLEEQEAMEALRSIPNLPQDVEKQLRAAMRASVPVWHVLVKGVDYPRKNLPVSIYFLQNLDELRNLVYQCLIELLEQDDPSILQEAVDNPQFRDWCHQWYQQSEDLQDERSVRYICRLSGCDVLTRCVRNDFGDCTSFLLNNHSDITSSEPHLRLAEPMRYFGKFQMNAFLEAAYNGAPAALKALICYGNAHSLPWREARDANGQTALDIAQSQVEKGRSGAESCFLLLKTEYSADTDMPRLPRAETVAENVLIVSWTDEDDQELQRIRQPLPLESSWSDLVRASQAALMNPPHVPGSPCVMIYKSIITDSEVSDIREFFELWNEAKSIGLFKSKIQHPDAPLHICDTVADLLSRPDMPSWSRLYVFGSFAWNDLPNDAASRLAAAVRGLADTLASQWQLPLWRLDGLPARLFLPQDRYLSNLVKAAMDVKHCLHQLDEGKDIYRFFWPRLEAVERHMLDRMKLLNDTALTNVAKAIDPQAVTYLESCVQLWVSSLRSAQGKHERLSSVLSQVDNALSGALLMHNTLTGLARAISEALPQDMLTLLPETAAELLNMGFGKDANAREGYACNGQSRAPALSSIVSETQQLRPAWALAPRHQTSTGASRMGKNKEQEPSDTIQPEDSLSNLGDTVAKELSHPSPMELPSSVISQTSVASQLSSSFISAPGATCARCFLADALFRVPGSSYLQAQRLTIGTVVCAANGGQLSVKSIQVHEQKEHEVVTLRSATASLKVTSTHRVMVQKRGHGSQTVTAITLRPGDPVLCTGGRVEELVEMQKWTEKVDVVQVVFEPDEPVEAFFPPLPAILSKGHGSVKTRRSMRGQHQYIERASVPDTDYGNEW